MRPRKRLQGSKCTVQTRGRAGKQVQGRMTNCGNGKKNEEKKRQEEEERREERERWLNRQMTNRWKNKEMGR